jgi:hypothetical protein
MRGRPTAIFRYSGADGEGFGRRDSVEGAGEALSIGAAGLLPRPLGSNPMDVHLRTSINLRRYCCGRLDGISLKNKLMLLLTWQSGPEIRSTTGRMEPYPQPDMEAVAALPSRTQEGSVSL